jgi:phage FluMu protein Com
VQSVYLSAGKALCRFCGEHVATNSLSVHIAKKHPRPKRLDMSPTLVPRKGAAKKLT